MLPTLLGFPVYPWYTYATLLLLSLLGVALAWVLCRIALQGLYHGLLTYVLAPLFRWAEPFTGLGLSTFGSAHWARTFELKRAGLFRPDGLPLGTWQGRELHEPTGGHICLIGPSRSRKSLGLVVPALRQHRGSVVCSDLRGELHRMTAKDREALGPTLRYDPTGKDSISLNVLDGVRWGQEHEYGDLMRICHHLVMPLGAAQASPFQLPAVPLLGAIATHCHLQGEGHLPGVLQWMTSPGQSMQDKLQGLLASAHPVVRAGARRTLDQSDRLAASVWNAAVAAIDVFADPLIARHSMTSDVTLEELRTGLQPTSLFLCMGFADIARLGPLLGAIVEALLAHLGSSEPPRHQVLLALDELANLGKVEGLERGVSYLQGSGAQCLLTFQNCTQVIQTYGPNSPLLASCSTKVYYTANDVLTATAMSAQSGEMTTVAASSGVMGSGGSFSQTEAARPLLTVDDALRLPQDEAILYVQGCAPIKATKLGAPVPTPTTTPGTVLAWGQRYRRALVPTLVGLFLAVTLWPLTRLQTPPMPSRVVASVPSAPPTPGPPAAAITAPTTGPWHLKNAELGPGQGRPFTAPTTGPWHLKNAELGPGQGRPFTAEARYPTRNACTSALHAHWEPLLAHLEHAATTGPVQVEVTRQPDRLRWQTRWPRERPQVREAWCEEQTAGSTP